MESTIEAVELQNFGSFGNKPTRVILGRDPGLYSIYGVNGQGKSTVRDAIYFGLYGKSYRSTITLKNLVNWTNERGMMVSTWFACSEGRFRIRRTPSSDKLYKVLVPGFDGDEANGGEEEITGVTDKAGFQAMIDRLYGIGDDLARNLVFISSSSTKPFPLLKTGEKRELVSDYFRLGIIALMDAIALKRQSDAKSNLRIAETSLISATSKHEMAVGAVARAEVDAENAYSLVNSDRTLRRLTIAGKQTLAKNAVEKHALDTTASDALAKANAQMAERDAIIATESVHADTDLFKDREVVNASHLRVTTANATSEQAIELENTQFAQIEAGINAKYAKIIEQNANVDKEEADAIATLELKVADYRATKTTERDNVILAKKTALDQLNVSASELAGVIAVRDQFRLANPMSFAEDNAVISECEQALAVITSKATELKANKQKIETADVCPWCNGVVTAEHRANEIVRMTAEWNNLISERTRLTKLIAEARARIEATNALVAQFHELETKVLATDYAHRGVINNNASTSMIRDVDVDTVVTDYRNSEWAMLAAKFASRRVVGSPDLELADARLVHERKLSELRSTIRDYDLAGALGQAVQRHLTRTTEIINDVNSRLERALSDANHLVLTYEATKKTLEANHTTASEELTAFDAVVIQKDMSGVVRAEAELEEYRTALKDNQTKVDTEAHNVAVLSAVREVLSDDGAKQTFIRKFVAALNLRVNHHLHYYGLPTTVVFDELLDLVLHNSRSNRPVVFAQHSGGEQRRLAISILMSMVELSMEMMAWRSGFMFLDEFLDDGMDEKGMEDTFEILKSYAERKGIRLYIISHKVSGDYFVEKLNVSKPDDFSIVAKG